MKNMQWRLGLIAIVIGLSVWAFYPPGSKVKLGLDLKGGVHLVLRVKTDDALKVETDTTVDRLRDTLTRAGVAFSKLEATSPTEFRVDGITDDAAFRTQAADAETVYDRSSETGGYSYRIKPNVANQLRDETVSQALETIERRVNELGVAEPIVARYGARDQILVQLPGVSDVRRAKEIIRSTARLELRLVDQGPFPNREAALQAFNNVLPPDAELLPGKSEGSGGTAGAVYYAVKKVSAVAGNDLRNAQQSLDEFNRPAVHFTLKQDAAVRFGSFTEANIGRPMAIILDGRVMSVATIQGRITDSGQITGITREEMLDQVITLKSGALPASMDYLEERTVGPSLGQDSIRAGVTASLAGLALVIVFMVFYYKLTGINAVVSIVVNLLILLGLMAAIPVTMTLPGVAGFILTIGMGVDSNVLIFERIKEELATARGARAAVNAGFDRVWWTIVDTHVSSLIAALLLLQFGTGPIRGFAVTLIIGLLSNVFTAVFVSRTMFEAVLARRQQAQTLSI
ncbi:MAG TPA: protein translocase subunit SecD [Vicinamibacterales bacterium]|nr:protein translocase subunit SecD [Vicinamibacterales bacterium]